MSKKPDRHAARILNFYKSLQPEFPVPDNVEVMNPYLETATMKYVKKFYHKFYYDSSERVLIFGINPGRFGGGVTGIPFTDPVRLEEDCGIKNTLIKKEELSAQFVYKMIHAYGGPGSFYKKFFITALSPLGFTRNGLNLNYYDDKELWAVSKHFIVSCIRAQLSIFHSSAICYCLGEGTNYKFFTKLNAEHRLFDKIVPLPHPRWIMQYRRKKINDFINVYLDKLPKNN